MPLALTLATPAVLAGLILVLVLLVQIRRRKAAEAALRERLAFEELLSEITSEFVNLPADQIDGKIQETQRRVCEFLDVDLSSLWQSASLDKPQLSRLTHVYRTYDDPPIPEDMDATEYFPFALKQAMAGEIAVIQVRDLPTEVAPEAARDRQSFDYFGIQSALIFPLLMERRQLVGILSFATVNRERIWAEPLIRQLDLLSQVYVSALARKNADAALRESEARLSLTTTAAQAGLWILDLETGDYWISNIAKSMFQFAPEEPVTLESVLGRVHRDDRELVRLAIQEATAQGELTRCEYRIELPDGSTRWIASFGQCDAGPGPNRLMGVSMDFTERLKAENQVRRQWAQLAHATRLGTMGELTASLAHEIYQPLTAIRTNAEAAQRFLTRSVPDIGEVRSILEDIILDNSRADNVIRNIRNMLRKEPAALVALNLNEVIRDVLSLIRSDSLLRGMRLSVDLAPDLAAEPPLVSADRVQLQQVLINLILNSAAAMRGAPEDQRILVVKTAVHEGRFVHVAVTDRGHGFDQNSGNRLFEPFYTTKPDGMGMGLPISQTIIKALGGTISAMNNPEGGSTFSFSLPVVAQGEQ